MPNQFTPVNTSNQEAAFNQINNNFRKLDAESVTKSFGGQNSPDKLLIGKTGEETLGISYKKDSVDKIVFGKLPDGTYGLIFYDANGIPSIYMVIDTDGKPVLKVAKEGKNAQTGSDDDMVFNSAQNAFKIAKSGILPTSLVASGIPGTPNVVQFSINTGIISTTPLASMAFVDSISGGGRSPLPRIAFDSGGAAQSKIDHYVGIVSGNQVWFYVTVTSYLGAISAQNVRWYILQETAA